MKKAESEGKSFYLYLCSSLVLMKQNESLKLWYFFYQKERLFDMDQFFIQMI